MCLNDLSLNVQLKLTATAVHLEHSKVTSGLIMLYGSGNEQICQDGS